MTKRQTDPIERFTSRFIRSTPDECWEWTGSRLPDNGYGMFWPYGRAGGKWYGHRFSYMHFVGPIPDDATIDHLCRNRGCVNPGHLEPVSQLVNNRRARGWTEGSDGRWACAAGHPMPDDAMGGKSCSLCFDEWRARWRKGEARRGQADNYMAQWGRVRNMEVFLMEHPGLEIEAREFGLPLCRARLRAGWTYVDDSWLTPDGVGVPFGVGPLRT